MRTDGVPPGTPYRCLRCGLSTGGRGRYVPGTGAVAHATEDDCRRALDALQPVERWRPAAPPPDWLADTGVGFDDDLATIARSQARRRRP